jgi:acyl-CoA hydrolase
MFKVGHIINLVADTASTRKSYLHIAQPVTTRSMVESRARLEDPARVELMAIRHRSENDPFPEGFRELTPIETFAWEHLPEMADPVVRRGFIRLVDVLGAAHRESTADWLVYTNCDIGLHPHFYREVIRRIEGGWDAFCINRQDLPKTWKGKTLDVHELETIWKVPGAAHRGIDCCVFRREIVPQLDLGHVFIGVPPVGLVLMQQIARHSRRFDWIKTGRFTFHLGSDRAWRQAKPSPYAIANKRAAEGRYRRQRLHLPLMIRLWRRVRQAIGLNPTP